MRSNGATLNAQLSRVISECGHTDSIVVADAGLPVPHSEFTVLTASSRAIVRTGEFDLFSIVLLYSGVAF